MNHPKINIHKNLIYLRRSHHFSLEEVAEKIGVTRQAAAKWESGETVPDLFNCAALAALYDITVDDLLYFDGAVNKIGIAPKGKHMFGTTKIGERGQVVIPKAARDTLHFNIGDTLVVLGDETPGSQGIALVQSNAFMTLAKSIMENFYPRDENEATP